MPFPSNQEVLNFIKTSHKPHRLILSIRDEKHRPTRPNLTTALDAINDNDLEPIGDLRGFASEMAWVAGRWVAWVAVLGETKKETFQIGLPFAKTFRAHRIREDERAQFRISQFSNCRIERGGLVQLSDKNTWINRIELDPVELPFVFSALQREIAKLTAVYLNTEGLGRDLPTDHIDFDGISEVEVKELGPIAEFIIRHWRESTSNPPSREKIASTLAALGTRSRMRGKHVYRKDQILPHLHLRKQKI